MNEIPEEYKPKTEPENVNLRIGIEGEKLPATREQAYAVAAVLGLMPMTVQEFNALQELGVQFDGTSQRTTNGLMLITQQAVGVAMIEIAKAMKSGEKSMHKCAASLEKLGNIVIKCDKQLRDKGTRQPDKPPPALFDPTRPINLQQNNYYNTPPKEPEKVVDGQGGDAKALSADGHESS